MPDEPDDATMHMLLGAVVRDEDGSYTTTDEQGAMRLAPLEEAGWLWLRLHGKRYRIQPTDEGARVVRRWAARRAKEAALEFGRL